MNICRFIGGSTKLIQTANKYNKIFPIHTFKNINLIEYKSICSGCYYNLYISEGKYEKVSKYIFKKYFKDIMKERREKLNKLKW